jgi:hypothetical protein
MFGVRGECGEDSFDVVGGFVVEVFVKFLVHLGWGEGHFLSPCSMGRD